MSVVRIAKTSFASGEIGPAMLGRVDLRAFENGARTLRNVIVQPSGGVTRRPGLAHVAVLPGPARLVAFEFNTEQAYLLALLDGELRAYRDGVQVASLATPWTAAQIGQVAWTQSADTLLVVHPDVPPRSSRARRTRLGRSSRGPSSRTRACAISPITSSRARTRHSSPVPHPAP